MKRPIVHPRTAAERALYATLHQAATAGLRQPAITGSAVYDLAAEQARLAEEAERVRAARRAREAVEVAEFLRSFAES